MPPSEEGAQKTARTDAASHFKVGAVDVARLPDVVMPDFNVQSEIFPAFPEHSWHNKDPPQGLFWMGKMHRGVSSKGIYANMATILLP
jgi:hypothetical protein